MCGDVGKVSQVSVGGVKKCWGKYGKVWGKVRRSMLGSARGEV